MGKHRRRGGKTSKQWSSPENDDIVAQLQRQRQKQKARKEEEAADAAQNGGGVSSPIAAPSERKGGFQYDPVRKRYFPKAAFGPNCNNDVCLQRIQKQAGDGGVADKGPRRAVLINRPVLDSDGSVTGRDLQSVVFPGTCLPWLPWRCDDNACISVEWSRKGRRANTSRRTEMTGRNRYVPCTERTNLLLATSLEYCTSASRRVAITTMLASRSVARRGRVVPSLSTLDRIRDERMHIDLEERASCDGQTTTELSDEPIRGRRAHRIDGVQDSPPFWYSMLNPLQRPHPRDRQSPWSPVVPYDCKCKEHLHPTTPTFDILPAYIIRTLEEPRVTTAIPRMATISNDAIFYRGHSSPGGQPAWELPRSSETAKLLGVRVVRDGPGCLVGSVVYDAKEDQSQFNLQTVVEPTVTRDVTYALASPVNDFCFSHNQARQIDDGVVAFAHSGDKVAKSSFLDLSTGSIFSIDAWSTSEPLCVQFARGFDDKEALFGHRDGSVSMVDTRSRDARSFSLASDSFGSATSIQQILPDSPHLVAVKGSFGSCRIFDMRCFSNYRGHSAWWHRSTALKLSVPESMIHQTKSVRCTGLAIDPTGRIVIAPFAGRDNDIRFAMWDSGTGALLRTLNVGSVGDGTGPSAFCELSSVVTAGYEMLCKRDSHYPVISSDSWGLWFKTNVLANASSLPAGGGIHHLRF